MFDLNAIQNNSHISEDRKKLLQDWVANNCDATLIEADLVLSKKKKNKKEGVRELLTAAEMQQRGFPMEKIRAIVARGNGVADPDCPSIASLTKFWVVTSTKLIDTDEIKQEGRARIQADPNQALAGVLTPFDVGGASIGADNVQALLQNLTADGSPHPGQRCICTHMSKHVVFLI